MKTKIVYIIDTTSVGGAQMGMVRIVNSLLSSNDVFDITIVETIPSSGEVKSNINENVNIVPLNINSKIDIWKGLKLRSIINGADVLVCSLPYSSLVGVLAGRLCRVSNIYTWQHSTEYQNRTQKNMLKLSYRFSSKVLADSEATKQMLKSEIGISENKIVTLSLAGIDTKKYKPIKIDSVFGNTDAIHIVTVGRIVEPKGYDYLLECAQILSNYYQFHIVGSGGKMDEYKERLKSDGLTNVRFHGELSESDLISVLSSADIYFQPSKWEGLCITVLEAMSMSLPVVASKTGGMRETVLNGETGYLVDIGDIQGYISKLSKFGESKELRQKYGKAGRERVIKNYSKEAMKEDVTNNFVK